MKRLAIFLLCLALLVCATACFKSSKKDGSGDDASKPASATTAEQSVATTAAATTKAYTPKVGTVKDSLNVRRDASTDYDAVGGLSKGDKVTIIGEEGDFFKIEWHDQYGDYKEDFAYVYKHYVLVEGESTTAATTGAPVSDPTKPAA